ncbi:MAG: hypothetical protein SWC96_00475, partial [Thermodesulfobacteriota bacterium]|nr:hypothetical protein [Thermodesulfobacteriota bacterium]
MSDALAGTLQTGSFARAALHCEERKRRSNLDHLKSIFLKMFFSVLFLAARKVPKEPRPAAWPSAALGNQA